ncbi:unnamed protein product [Arctia plantaginis]|uniref:Uncharacterized protein n=1 Tax=Arctia plantaginis TaxID=874455 RepID=A0A8S1BR39_ARCPL|nr:unnamed protein product [Arctia plantaginis]
MRIIFAGDFMVRLKADLDKWIQDYFNDYLIMTSLKDVPTISALQKYDQKKATELAVFTDDALTMLNKKLRDIGGDAILLPDFKILTSYGLSITMHAGTLRGLNTMFRRSVATTILERTNLRYVDAIIGFSDMKVSYDYEINFPPSQHSPPTLNGAFIMSTNKLTAHLSLGFLSDREILELDFDFIKRMGVESITVEGGANLHIANFKHLLQHEIATIMSSSVTYGVRLLKTLPKCEPFVPGMLKKKAVAEIDKIRTTPQNLIVLVSSKEKVSTENE